MPMEFREKELQTLEERGYVVIENALTQPEIQSLLAHVDDLSTWICTIGDPRENGRLNVEASDDLSVVQLRKIQCSLDICPVMQKLSLSEATLGTVEALAGEPMWLWEDKIHLKKGNGGSAYPWHCDYYNWHESRFGSEDFLTCMLHLEDADEDNGALCVIPGSHKRFQDFPTYGATGNADAFAPGVHDPNIKDRRATDVDASDMSGAKIIAAKAGDIVIFGSKLQHKSGCNNSGRSRKVIFFTYSPLRYGNLYLTAIHQRAVHKFMPPLHGLPNGVKWDKAPVFSGKDTIQDVHYIAVHRNSKQTLSYYDDLKQYLDFANTDDNLIRARCFTKFTPRQNLSLFLAHNAIFQQILNIPGSIIECGVLYGSTLFTWAHLCEMYEPVHFCRKVYGFDTFSGFVDIAPEDVAGPGALNPQLRAGGFAADSYRDIQHAIKIFDKNRFLGHIPKIELVPGDVSVTAPTFIEANPQLVVAMLHLDVDLYKPTKHAIMMFVERMPKGGIIVFDELNHPDYPGETTALIDSLGFTDNNRSDVGAC